MFLFDHVTHRPLFFIPEEESKTRRTRLQPDTGAELQAAPSKTEEEFDLQAVSVFTSCRRGQINGPHRGGSTPALGCGWWATRT